MLAVVSASGALDVSGPSLEDGMIITAASAAESLRARVRSSTKVVVLTGAVDASAVMDAVHEHGGRFVVTEGGPSFFAQLVKARQLDELFVTTSPTLFGRFPNDGRKSLASGLDLEGVRLDLLSLRHHGSYSFARYRLPRGSEVGAASDEAHAE